MAGSQIGTNYERAKKFLRDFLLSFYTNCGETTRDDGGPAPMDVGAIGHDKGGVKGKKGKHGKQDKAARRSPRSSMASAPTATSGDTRRLIAGCWPRTRRREKQVLEKAKGRAPIL